MRNLILALIMACSIDSYSQFAGYCVDSLNPPDPWYQCALSAGGEEYNPVCGCYNITYRNTCAAINWGRLLNWTENTICGNFHIDFRPTAVSSNPAKFQAYIRNVSNKNISISIYIYDTFGKLEYAWFDATSQDGFYPFPNPLEIPAQRLKQGIYLLLVVINNEKQFIKFGKVID